ncbi:hypothetical protein FHS15_002192 [Paenibacillus castaneae]|uniref:ComEC/Rec2 family competence protein n=1 Tax=Paenibacillus castaneae TaxID=474957 RepID=UPI000C9C3AEC|nr:MBL fold metallo-hydrolase [Paenibacillus castaneae]NIK77067.1 hypothetical protein [Paenibacillus castaneae]
MSAKVQFLNVGWGDAHFIQLPSGSVCLIDGGDGASSPDQDHPLSWMNRNKIDRLDWMILTHIHEDHVNGLLDIATMKSVTKAVLPYEPFILPPEQLVYERGDDFTRRVFAMLASYLELVQVLSEQGTEIIWRSAYGSNEDCIVWSEEGVTLTHLYPWKGDPLPAYDVLFEAGTNSACYEDDYILDNIVQFFELSNHDSSVYRLSIMQEPDSNVLFGGDLLEPGWERLAERIDIRSSILKVSHHGLQDGFNARILSWIQPKHCIIPISMSRSSALLNDWEELLSHTDASLYVTGNLAMGEQLEINYGALKVQIGF